MKLSFQKTTFRSDLGSVVCPIVADTGEEIEDVTDVCIESGPERKTTMTFTVTIQPEE